MAQFDARAPHSEALENEEVFHENSLAASGLHPSLSQKPKKQNQ